MENTVDKIIEDVHQAYEKLDRQELQKLIVLDGEQDYDDLICSPLAATFSKESKYFNCQSGYNGDYGLYLSFKPKVSNYTGTLQIGYDGDIDIYPFLETIDAHSDFEINL